LLKQPPMEYARLPGTIEVIGKQHNVTFTVYDDDNDAEWAIYTTDRFINNYLPIDNDIKVLIRWVKGKDDP
jgi:hypothetical protein